MLYTEVMPPGPMPEGDVGGDDAVTEGFGRRFFRAHPTKPGQWLIANVVFYHAREASEPGEAEKPTTLNCELGYSIAEGDDPKTASADPWMAACDIRYLTVAEVDGVPTEADARDACADFDPAVLTWDGTDPIPAECWTVRR